ncbi:MAG: hypothetical protein LBT18_05195 [Endomicrobium sp.]|nr:hypothetical protein [Endomicrobium sp.]
MGNTDKIWQESSFEIKKGVQILITPNGWTLENKVIGPLKTPDFISLFCIKNDLIPVKWS